MAALRPNPSADGSVDELSDLLDLFKLEATHTSDYTLQVSMERDPSRGGRKVKLEKRWYRGHSLGHGAFGTVWVEHDNKVPSVASAVRAVKEISKGYLQKINLDYKHELVALAKLSKYPDEFVQFYGWFEDPRALYLTMEYFAHGDLDSFIEKGIPEEGVRSIAIQLLQGLEIMHENLFTHRDLKPANILVKSPSPHWWVKIGDFGIAKRVRKNTALRTEVGTRGFLAPEVVIYGHDEYSNSVDLWSLGCVVFKALTHVIPFPTTRSLELFCSGGPFPTEALVAKRITPEAVSFLKSLLVVDPKGRLTAAAGLDTQWLQTSRNSFQPQTKVPREAPIEGRISRPSGPLDCVTDKGVRELRTTLQSNDDRTPCQGSGFDEKALTVSNPTPQISHQTSDALKPITNQTPDQLPTDRGALPFELQDEGAAQAMAVDLAMRNGFDLQAADVDKAKVLHWAASDGHEPVVRLLLDRGAGVDAREGGVGETVLHRAASNGHEGVTLLLLERGADVEAEDGFGQTALFRAASRGRARSVRLLLEKKANVDTRVGESGETALCRAAREGHEAVVRQLLSYGADVKIEAKSEGAALHCAALRGHYTIVQLLLESGADAMARSVSGMSALHLAASGGQPIVVRLLLEKGADVNAREDRAGETALHKATWRGHDAVVGLLLEKGANVNSTERRGETALHQAASKGYRAVARLLLENGADVNIKSTNGRTALELAIRNGHDEVARLLQFYR